MSDGTLVLRRATVRILDSDRRLDIYKGWVEAPAAFFEKYGKRFVNEPKVGKEKDAPIRRITSWAEKSRAAEFAEIRKANRIAAKREAEEFAAADKRVAKAEVAQEAAAASVDEAGSEEIVEGTEESAPEVKAPATAKGNDLLPPEKATWKGAKKLKSK